MSRLKYGIDLGTTNSAIAIIDKGESVIIKSEIQKDTMPSCLGYNKRKSLSVGDRSFNQLNSDKLKALRDGRTMSSTFLLNLNEQWGLTKNTSPRLWKLIFLRKNYLPKYSRN